MKKIFLILFMLICFMQTEAKVTPQFIYQSTVPPSGSFTSLSSCTGYKNQCMYRPSEFPGLHAGKVVAVYLMSRVSSPTVVQTIRHLTVSMGHIPINESGPNPDTVRHTPVKFYPCTQVMYDPLFSIPAPLDSGDWIKFTFQTPFQFDGSTNFIVEYWFDSTNFNPAQGNPILIGNVIYGKLLRRIACGNWVANTTNWGPENLEANIDMLGIDLASTDVEDISEQESLSVYPNPAQGTLSISGMNKGAYQISDMVGKMLLQGSYAGKGIDISSLSQGVYLIQIATGERKQTLKFVKE